MTKAMKEYLRRNLLHAAAVGAHAGTRTALERLAHWKRAPQWLLKQLEGVSQRTERVAHEMAKHRDEKSPYRKKQS